MAWYITDGILERSDSPRSDSSILTDITGSGHVIVPEGVTAIAKDTFGYCSLMTGITIPDSLTRIGSDAFLNCFGLTEITVPEGVTSIEAAAFWNCTELNAVHLPSTLTAIGKMRSIAV